MVVAAAVVTVGAVPIDVVLPCLDEAAALPWVLARLPHGYRAVVADNGSTDGSPEIAARLGAMVVTVPRRGYGAAVHAGLEAATSETVCVMDADGSLDPAQLGAVAAPVLHGTADMGLGRRRPTTWGAWPLPARAANAALVASVRRRTGLGLRDLGPMRVARRQDLLDLGLSDRRSGYPLETVLAAHHRGWRLVEVPVDYLPRTGRSKVTGTLPGYLRAVRDMRAVLLR